VCSTFWKSSAGWKVGSSARHCCRFRRLRGGKSGGLAPLSCSRSHTLAHADAPRAVPPTQQLALGQLQQALLSAEVLVDEGCARRGTCAFCTVRSRRARAPSKMWTHSSTGSSSSASSSCAGTVCSLPSHEHRGNPHLCDEVHHFLGLFEDEVVVWRRHAELGHHPLDDALATAVSQNGDGSSPLSASDGRCTLMRSLTTSGVSSCAREVSRLSLAKPARARLRQHIVPYAGDWRRPPRAAPQASAQAYDCAAARRRGQPEMRRGGGWARDGNRTVASAILSRNGVLRVASCVSWLEGSDQQ
jgi:hypothetical protein